LALFFASQKNRNYSPSFNRIFPEKSKLRYGLMAGFLLAARSQAVLQGHDGKF